MRNRRLVLSLVTAGAFLVSCGGDTAEQAGPSPATTSAPPSTATSAPPSTPPETAAGEVILVTVPDTPTGGSFRFDTPRIELEAGTTYTLTLDNQDQGTTHNIHVTVGDVDVITPLKIGPATDSVELTVPEAGEGKFWCDVHEPFMKGSVVVT